MRIERLALKGLTRFVDPITIDLRDVPPGIIAVVGPNGAGKTTLLEAMFAGFYGEMPSRSDRSLVDLVNGQPDAYIEVEASLPGKGAYRGRLQLDGVRRTRDAVLEHIGADGQRRLLTDGKVTTYAAKVAELFPPASVMLATAFAAQNKKGSFVTSDRKARKDLFSQLLGHEHLERMATTARSAAALVDRSLAETTAQIKTLAALVTADQVAALEAEGNRLQHRLIALDDEREALAATIARWEQTLADLRAQDAAQRETRDRHAALVQEQADLRARLAQVSQAIEAAKADAERQIAARQTAYETRRAEIQTHLDLLPTPEAVEAERTAAIAQAEQAYRTAVADLDTRITNNRTLLHQADTLRATAARLRELEAERQQVADRLTAIEQAIAAARARQHALSAQVSHLAVLRHKVEAAEQAQRQIAQLPFGAQCVASGCAFVAGAAAAIEDLDALRGQVAALEAAAAQGQAIEAELADLTATQDDLRTQHQRLDQEIAALDPQTLHARLARLDVAEARIVELEADRARAATARDEAVAEAHARAERRLRETVERARALRHEADGLREARDADVAAIEATREARIAELSAPVWTFNARLHELEAAIAPLEAAVRQQAQLDAQLTDAEAQLTQARAAQAARDTDRARLTAEIEAFERRRADVLARQAQRERLEAVRRTLETELVEWQALDRIFGRNGLPVFEIDAAGPTVSSLANDLLHACFGGRFSVELVTETAKASGKGTKETFEIRVWDAERGGEPRDLTDLSGGEQVIVDEAIKSALAAFNNLRSGHAIQTLWRDESAGALDVDNGPRYMAMLRRLHERCGLHHLFVVVHQPDLAALADVQLVVRDGTATLVYPPFDRAMEVAA